VILEKSIYIVLIFSVRLISNVARLYRPITGTGYDVFTPMNQYDTHGTDHVARPSNLRSRCLRRRSKSLSHTSASVNTVSCPVYTDA